MTLDCSQPGKAQIKMLDCIDDVLAELPSDMNGEAAAPASKHPFEVNNDNPIFLSQERSETFHHLVAKTLFMSKKARPDLQMAQWHSSVPG